MIKICRSYITTRDGRRITAKELGKKAICFWVTEEEQQKYLRRMRNKKAKKQADNDDVYNRNESDKKKDEIG